MGLPSPSWLNTGKDTRKINEEFASSEVVETTNVLRGEPWTCSWAMCFLMTKLFPYYLYIDNTFLFYEHKIGRCCLIFIMHVTLIFLYQWFGNSTHLQDSWPQKHNSNLIFFHLGRQLHVRPSDTVERSDFLRQSWFQGISTQPEMTDTSNLTQFSQLQLEVLILKNVNSGDHTYRFLCMETRWPIWLAWWFPRTWFLSLGGCLFTQSPG